jgi:ELWxxDGT repeat protein
LVTSSNDGIANIGVYPSGLTNVNGTLYFLGLDLNTGTQVFKSDGTAAGTAPATNIGAKGCHPSLLTSMGTNLYFQASDGVHGYQLWDSTRPPAVRPC